jgi:hypothetical protein
MRTLLVVLALIQPGQRPPLSPAETLLAPAMLEAIRDEAIKGETPMASRVDPTTPIEGTNPGAGEIVIGSDLRNGAAILTMQTLRSLVEARRLPRPQRTIRLVGLDAAPPATTRAAILLRAVSTSVGFGVIRNLWANASVTDEVVELFGRHFAGIVEVGEMTAVQARWESPGVATTMIFYRSSDRERSAALVAAASAYFLATLPNAGAEALLSHLMVGAHARLAEDGRKAVAQMGNQQRAGADVLIMFAQAIEREQRRIRSFARFMPTPLDPAVNARLSDMENGITSVWTSMGITSAPFVPAAERIRGRGGEDRRVPSRLRDGPLPTADPPTAMVKFPNVDVIVYELGNFIDGKRSISDIRDAVSAEFGPIALPVVADYFERLAKTGAVAIR